MFIPYAPIPIQLDSDEQEFKSQNETPHEWRDHKVTASNEKEIKRGYGYFHDYSKKFPVSHSYKNMDEVKPSGNSITSRPKSKDKISNYSDRINKDKTFKAIVVNGHGRVMDGHHRYEAARKVGKKTIPVHQVHGKDETHYIVGEGWKEG